MRTATLRDGSRVVIRSVEPDDRGVLADAFERLSPETRYRRFFAPVHELSERDLDYLTRVDHHDHEALLAVDAESGAGVGVARYVRTAPEVAEPAIVVVDDWQGRGVASLLLDALVERARAEGVRRFDAPVLATNWVAMRALERLGDATRRSDGGEVELRIELRDEPGARRREHGLLREFAVGVVQPARSLVELLWPRRRGAPDAPRRNVVVVGTDGSDHADAAVEAAASVAGAFEATVHVVGAHPFLLPDRADVTDAVRRTAAALRDRGLHVHEDLRRGDPAVVLASVAVEQDARLVVVGAGEHAKLTRRLIGSVADSVAQRSPCDVLIVRR